MDCSNLSYYSRAADANASTDNLFPKDGDHGPMASPLIGDQLVIMEGADYLSPTVDFSTVTPADFGITPETFTKQSKGGSKSLVSKLKRRSTIGVRGSPENNSLIRYLAHQRRVKKQKTFSEATPLARQSTLLKAKMAAFQSSFKTLDETEEKGIHIRETRMKPLHANEELSRHVSFRNSGKKVRFAKEQRLDIFDHTKPPVTPLQSCLPSSSLRSALKKTPVKELPDSMVEDLHLLGLERGIEQLSDWHSYETLQREQNHRTVEEVKQGKKEPGSDVSETQPPVDIPSCREDRAPFSPSASVEEDFRNVTPIKQSISQPNFDDDDDDDDKGQEPLEVAVKPECAASPDLEETKTNPLDLQATCVRITRSCTKGKRVGGTAKTDLSPASKAPAKKNPKRKSGEFEKANTAAKSSQKKTAAARRKVSGKRRKKKKEQKALYGQRETVSKVPLLSPIPELKEEVSVVLSYQSLPSAQSSFLDDSVSSLLRGHLADGTAEDRVLCFDEDSTNCLNLLNGMDDGTSPSPRLQDSAANGTKKIVPRDSPEKTSPEKPKGASPESNRASENDCPSDKDVQKEPELLNPSETDGDHKAEGFLPFMGASQAEPVGGRDGVDLKKCPRRSRRSTCSRSSTEAFQSETPGKEVEGLPPAADGGPFFENFERSAEDRPRRVRRSMRQHRDTENEGLVWIHIPAHDARGQTPLGSLSRAKKRRSSFAPQGCDLLHQAQMHSLPALFPVNGEQEKALAAVASHGSKRRRNSLRVLNLKENEGVVLRVQRNRRASLGYNSDLCYRKECETGTSLRSQLVI